MNTLEYSDIRRAFDGEDIYHAVLAHQGVYTTRSGSRYRVSDGGTVLTNIASGESWKGTILRVRLWNGKEHLVAMEQNARGWSWMLRTSAIFCTEVAA